MNMNKTIVIVFSLIIILFAALLLGMFLPFQGEIFRFFLFPAGVILAGLGVALIVLSAKKVKDRAYKVFLMVTGSAAAGIVVSSVLHNLVYALLVRLSIDIADEPVFFILATIICPVALLAGIAGSITLMVKKRKFS